jgi:hypothetical protein
MVGRNLAVLFFLILVYIDNYSRMVFTLKPVDQEVGCVLKNEK